MSRRFPHLRPLCGCSSVVEHLLAKERVEFESLHPLIHCLIVYLLLFPTIFLFWILLFSIESLLLLFVKSTYLFFSLVFLMLFFTT